MAIEVRMDNHIDEAKKAFEDAVKRALEACGLTAEGYAKAGCPVDIGALRNSISHTVDGNVCYIGTNMNYAPYVELGTGIYATAGGGRMTPWVYCDGKGNWHYTRGQHAQPFLKPAVADHTDMYQNLIQTYLQG